MARENAGASARRNPAVAGKDDRKPYRRPAIAGCSTCHPERRSSVYNREYGLAFARAGPR